MVGDVRSNSSDDHSGYHHVGSIDKVYFKGRPAWRRERVGNDSQHYTSFGQI